MGPTIHACSTASLRSAVRAAPVRQGHRVSVVLLEQLDNLGYKGEEVTVAPGYARNWLLPQRKAVYATEPSRAAHKRALPEAEAKAIGEERAKNMMRARIGHERLRFVRATTDGAALYSALTAADVVEALAATPSLRKLRVKEKNVRLGSADDRTLKVVGEHTIEIEPEAAGYAGMWCPLAVVIESS
jgi:large subunit ribosomal protein L9